jgi:hypothetical protein
MLAPDELLATAALVQAEHGVESQARVGRMSLNRVRAGGSDSWRLLHHEVPLMLPVAEPLWGEAAAVPPQQPAQTRIWLAREARLTGRRGLVDANGALFLDGPVRTEADMARAVSLCAVGGEGFMLRPVGAAEAQMLAPFPNGERRLTGTGLHLGAAVGDFARPFLLEAFAALLLIAEMRPKLDYVVLAGNDPALPALLTELGFEGLKIFDLDLLPGVICTEIMMPLVARDPAGWVDSGTIRRLREFAARAHAKLGPGVHTTPEKIFLTDRDRLAGPMAAMAEQLGYLVRGLAGRSVTDLALLMAKASCVATDQEAGVTASLFAAAEVPVLDLAGGDQAARLPLLAGCGRRFAVAAPQQAQAALAQLAGMGA